MKYNVIAIEREYASGGREIGEKLAIRMEIPCYNQEILEKAAVKLNLPAESLTDAEEKITGSLLYNMSALTNLRTTKETDYFSLEQRLAYAEIGVIKNLTINPCVVIGRGAAALLKDKVNVLKVFIHADHEARIERAVNVYGIESKQSESILRRFDKRRAAFFKATTSTEWKDADIYHMFLNSGKLGIDPAVDVLYRICL
jgi:cytidylate kinase